MADSYLYEASQMSDSTVEPFTRKELLWIADSNGGSYNGSVVFDGSQLSNSGKMIDLTSAFLVLPFVIVSKSSGDITASANAFLAGIKNGNHQLVHSIQVDVNNKNVVQLSSFLNHYVSYKLMTSFSSDDVKKHGAGINFSPDTATSFQFNLTGANKDGVSLTNNRVTSSATLDVSSAGYKGAMANEGYLQRLRNVMDYSNQGRVTATNFGGVCFSTSGPFMTDTNFVTSGKSYFTDDNGTGAARIYTHHILAKIRLKDLHPYFQSVPLIKGQFLKITINYNASSQTVSYTNTGTTVTLQQAPTITGGTNPIMISSGAANNPNATNWSTADRTHGFACGIYSATEPLSSTAKTNAILSQCRLYAELYTMNPTFEDQYLSLMPTKTVRYTDIYNYVITGQTGAFNSLVTNGIVAPKTVIVIPYLNKASNTGLSSVPVYQSPFTTEPGTTSPFCGISNFNVAVSGINCFSQNQSYDYEQFLTEVTPQNALNGSKATGISSGLIDYQMWQHGYRYYVADVSRRLPLDMTVPKSLMVSGTINCQKTVDLMVFVEFEREITYDMATGAVIEA